LVGVYRGIWRYTGIDDLVTFAKGVLLGSAGSIVTILLLYRFRNFSRAVFIADAVILLMGLVASRIAFRLFRQLLPTGNATGGKKVLIYGAGDGGEMVYRELRNNSAWGAVAVGFIDDDPLKRNKVIHGLKVFDTNGSLPETLRSKDVQEIVISFKDVPDEAMERMKNICRSAGISLRRAKMHMENIDLD
jgi:UDP-GlcNAc:undecaprenyl-phosphate GlcNAc-1-phosphate transferase